MEPLADFHRTCEGGILFVASQDPPVGVNDILNRCAGRGRLVGELDVMTTPILLQLIDGDDLGIEDSLDTDSKGLSSGRFRLF